MLFTFDDATDRDRASDGVSRYGAYLRLNADRFDDGDGAVTTDPGEFAAAAWQVATSPIMAPAYLDWTADRVQSVTFTRSYDTFALITRVQVAVPRPAALSGVRGFSEWGRGYRAPGDDALSRRPAMLTSCVLLYEIGAGELHSPAAAPARLTVADAKAAVKRLAALLDARLAPVLAALDTPAASGRTTGRAGGAW